MLRTVFLSLLLLMLCSCSFPVNDVVDDLGGGYTFVSESSHNQFVSGPNDTLNVTAIPCTVKAVDSNNDFIVASQIDNPDCFRGEAPNQKLTYWIIRKADGRNFGPLDSLQYINKRDELEVPFTLSVSQ
jgi:hypothetical protein